MPKWESACDTAASGGGAQCNQVAVASFDTLLAAPGPCEQQNAADNIVDLAKTLNNNADMIKFAQIFVQQPRNSPISLSFPYCQSTPRNTDLNGLLQCQFQGDNLTSFVGGIAVGGDGTIPFGMSAAVNPAGLAPQTPPALSLMNPGVGVTTVSNSTTSGRNSTLTATPSATSSSDSDCEEDPTDTMSTASPTTSATSAAAVAPSATSSSTSANFKLTNSQNAQELGARFAMLTANSSCTDGANACVNGTFAQCVGGTYVTQSCGLTCTALPLVNSAGTSITCTTNADALARIVATGVRGGLTG